MDYEKKYNEVLSKAKDMLSYKEARQEDMEYLFPELKESGYDKNKRISKEITKFLKQNNGWNREWLTWLEKQGEEKPTDNKEKLYVLKFIRKETCCGLAEANNALLKLIKVLKEHPLPIMDKSYKLKIEWDEEKKELEKIEPKFKVGDWITDGYLHCKIIYVLDDGYIVDTKFAKRTSIPFECESNYHLWTIQDAKDGDVLSYVTDEENLLWTMIYWSLYEPYEGHVHYHALLVNDDFTDKGTCYICIDNLKPATKEQCDTIFAKMREAGYEWDAEKKELKKIEQKPSWGEEDEVRIEQICEDLKCGLENFRSGKNVKGLHIEEIIKSNIDWLKSLKERVLPQNT